jgi:endoglucanase
VWSTQVGGAIPAPDEQNMVPLTGFNAGEGLLVVPAGSLLVAYAGATGVTPTSTPSATTTTASPSPSSTPTPTSTATATPTPTQTPGSGGGSVLMADGFEGTTIASTGWSADVSGNGAVASLVSSPVFAGNQAAGFSTQTQQNGEHAFAEHAFSRPSTQVATAEAEVQFQSTSIQFFSKILSLETHGPNNWGARAGYALGPSTFWVLYMTRDGLSHQVDLGQPYTTGRWYDLAVTVDYRAPNPVLTWQIAGQPVYTVTDSTLGPNTDLPGGVRVGIGPGAWGASAGTVLFDAVSVRSGAGGTSTVTPTATSTPTATVTVSSTPTPSPTATPGATPTNTPAPSSTATSTNTPTATSTPTPSVTSTPTAGVPAAPTNLTARAGSGLISLTWSSTVAAGATFNVYRGTGGAKSLAATGLLSTSYTDSANLRKGQTYYYQVSASNAAGESAWSNEVSVKAH